MNVQSQWGYVRAVCWIYCVWFMSRLNALQCRYIGWILFWLSITMNGLSWIINWFKLFLVTYVVDSTWHWVSTLFYFKGFNVILTPTKWLSVNDVIYRILMTHQCFILSCGRLKNLHNFIIKKTYLLSVYNCYTQW